MANPVCILPPADAPVSLAAAKAHLHVDHSNDDDLIAALVAAAVAHFDGWSGVLGRALEAQTWEMALDRFPPNEIQLPLGPVASVVSVKYRDPSGVEQTISPYDYETDLTPIEGWIVPSITWPETLATINAVRVRWVAGTGCPAPVRQAILLLVGHWYATREAAGGAMSEIPFGVNALATPYRRAWL